MLFHIDITKITYFKMNLKRKLRWKFNEAELDHLYQGLGAIIKQYDKYKIRIDSYRDSDAINGVDHTLTLTAHGLPEYVSCFKVDYSLTISEYEKIRVFRSDVGEIFTRQFGGYIHDWIQLNVINKDYRVVLKLEITEIMVRNPLSGNYERVTEREIQYEYGFS